MSHLPFGERDIERLLEGNVPAGRGDLVELARLFARVRAGVEGEPIPPMSARLLAELDAAELKGRLESELDRAAERRRVQRGRRRWRMVAAAAAIAVIGGAVIATMRGPLGDDLRTRPGDESVSVAEPDGSSSSTVADDESSGGVETAGPDEGSPSFSPDDDHQSGDLGVGSASSGVVTTEVPDAQPPADTNGTSGTGEADWSDLAANCDGHTGCVINAANDSCEDGDLACWAAAAQACGDDPGCKGELIEMCGNSDQCRAAIWYGPSSQNRPGGGR